MVRLEEPSDVPTFVLGRAFAVLAVTVALALISGLGIWLSRAATLAVAPSDGPEPPPIGAHAGALARGPENLRLKVVAVVAPASAQGLVASVAAASCIRKVAFVSVEDADATVERLHAATTPAGSLGGNPRLPPAEVETVGSSYRLMATSALNRITAADTTWHLLGSGTQYDAVTPAGGYTCQPRAMRRRGPPQAPACRSIPGRSTMTSASSAPSATGIRTESTSSPRSADAWLRQRLAPTRRERIDEVFDPLIEILDTARTAATKADLDALAKPIDALSADELHHARHDGTDSRRFGTLAPAIHNARKAVSDARLQVGTGAAISRPN